MALEGTALVYGKADSREPNWDFLKRKLFKLLTRRSGGGCMAQRLEALRQPQSASKGPAHTAPLLREVGTTRGPPERVFGRRSSVRRRRSPPSSSFP